MLADAQFNDWFYEHRIEKMVEEVIRRIRTSPPLATFRVVKSNVSGRDQVAKWVSSSRQRTTNTNSHLSENTSTTITS